MSEERANIVAALRRRASTIQFIGGHTPTHCVTVGSYIIDGGAAKAFLEAIADSIEAGFGR
jgi:hypothetical protein